MRMDEITDKELEEELKRRQYAKRKALMKKLGLDHLMKE